MFQSLTVTQYPGPMSLVFPDGKSCFLKLIRNRMQRMFLRVVLAVSGTRTDHQPLKQGLVNMHRCVKCLQANRFLDVYSAVSHVVVQMMQPLQDLVLEAVACMFECYNECARLNYYIETLPTSAWMYHYVQII